MHIQVGTNYSLNLASTDQKVELSANIHTKI